MNDREQKQNDLLARCIRDDPSGDLHRGEEQIMHAQREERCVRPAMWLTAVLAAIAALGLGYSALLLDEAPAYQTQRIDHVFRVVGLASLLSCLAFGGFWVFCRNRLVARREECRRVMMKLLAGRAGNSGSASSAEIPSPRNEKRA